MTNWWRGVLTVAGTVGVLAGLVLLFVPGQTIRMLESARAAGRLPALVVLVGGAVTVVVALSSKRRRGWRGAGRRGPSRGRASWRKPGVRGKVLPLRRLPDDVESDRANWSARAQVATSIVAALTALVALFYTGRSAEATRDQLRLNEQGQITDRYSRAIEQLGQPGADKVDVRLGATYALERIMHDSPSDQPTLIEILASFVRVHAPLPSPPSAPVAVPSPVPASTPSPTPSPTADGAPLAADIQAVLSVLGRRDLRHDGGVLIDLHQTDLHGVNLYGAKLSGPHPANLRGANLSGADLTLADLRGVDLRGSDLRRVHGNGGTNLSNAYLSAANLTDADVNGWDLVFASLEAADLRGATVRGANMTRANLRGANLSGAKIVAANMTEANLDGAILNGADLRNARVTTEQLSCAIVDSATRLPSGFTVPSARSPSCGR